MQTSSPSFHLPSTPSPKNHRYPGLGHQPFSSSPLASPSNQSQVSVTQARRHSQYKSRTPRTPSNSLRSGLGGSRCSGGILLEGGDGSTSTEAPQKTFLREKFKARCLERAQKARERAIRGRRWSDPSSDGFDDAMDCEGEEEDDESVMQDEVRWLPTFRFDICA